MALLPAYPALYVAILDRDAEAVGRILRTDKKDLEWRDDAGHTPLMYAILNNDLPIVQLLLDAGADIDATIANNSGFTTLMAAAYSGADMLKRVLPHARHLIHTTDSFTSASSLMWAAGRDDAECVRILIDAGGEVGYKDKQGKSVLMSAVTKQLSPNIVRILLQHGADPHDKSDGLEMILHCLAPPTSDTAAAADILCELMKYELPLEARNTDGYTPLALTIWHNNIPMARELLALGANINTQDNKGQTPLFYAIKDKNESMLKLIFSSGIDLGPSGVFGITDKSGRTAFQYNSDDAFLANAATWAAEGRAQWERAQLEREISKIHRGTDKPVRVTPRLRLKV